VEFDLFTFSAQIVNFIILVVLLRVFLYKRIIEAMDKREERIASRLQEAEERETSAREQEEELKTKNRELDEKRDELIAEARKEAEARREELLEKAESEVRKKKDEWLGAVEDDKKQMMSDIREVTARTLLDTVRSIVHDLAGAELEAQILHTFLSRLASASEEERDGLEGDLVIRSSFPLDDEQRGMAEEQLREVIRDSGSWTFETDEQMSFGIEISSQSVKISWTVDTYIDSLKDEMEKRLQEEAEGLGDG